MSQAEWATEAALSELWVTFETVILAFLPPCGDTVQQSSNLKMILESIESFNIVKKIKTYTYTV